MISDTGKLSQARVWYNDNGVIKKVKKIYFNNGSDIKVNINYGGQQIGVKIKDLPSSSGIKKEDLLIVEDEESTKKCTIQQLDTALGISALKQKFDSLGLSVDEEGYIVQEVEDE